MDFNEKKIYRFTAIYGIIVVLANICGVLIPNTFENQIILNQSESMKEWLRYLHDDALYADPIQYLSFIIPTVLCFLYTSSKKRDFQATIVNLPIAYATRGVSGWVFYLLEEPVLLFIAKAKGYNVDISSIFFSSLLNICLEATATFTLAYFITVTIHRRFVLPKLFPEGKISRIKGVKQPSLKFLFNVNYVSVTIFPIIYLLLVFNALTKITYVEINNDIYLILLAILLIGLIINAALISYFQKPIEALKERIEQIKKGDYKTHVQIVTNDSFGELSDIMNEMTDSIESKTKKILEIQNSVITGMATMVESRDNSTGGHIRRTSDCVKVFINQLKQTQEYNQLSDSFCQAVIKAAPMHDLGKIAVDDAILRKPGKFTDEEYEKMKSHSAEGARIVENVLSAVDDIEFKQIAINVANYHHEKWNGQGYPEKISGEQIPLEARIMALADVFDALVSKRCYKDSFTYDKAFEIIQESLGSHFDPNLGAEFIKCRPQLEELYNSYLQ